MTHRGQLGVTMNLSEPESLAVVAETPCCLAKSLIDVPASCSSVWHAGSCESEPAAATAEFNVDRRSGHSLGPPTATA